MTMYELIVNEIIKIMAISIKFRLIIAYELMYTYGSRSSSSKFECHEDRTRTSSRMKAPMSI